MVGVPQNVEEYHRSRLPDDSTDDSKPKPFTPVPDASLAPRTVRFYGRLAVSSRFLPVH